MLTGNVRRSHIAIAINCVILGWIDALTDQSLLSISHALPLSSLLASVRSFRKETFFIKSLVMDTIIHCCVLSVLHLQSRECLFATRAPCIERSYLVLDLTHHRLIIFGFRLLDWHYWVGCEPIAKILKVNNKDGLWGHRETYFLIWFLLH